MHKGKMKLIGPFRQLVTMDKMPLGGHLGDHTLEIIQDAGILVHDGLVDTVGAFKDMRNKNVAVETIEDNIVVLPGFVDAHTHICWAGSREDDYAKRLSGKSYLEIAREGGGIWSTVVNTRKASAEELTGLTLIRANQMLRQGITTIEVKSGYGLDTANELKILESIRDANEKAAADMISTCLAAHTRPRDFSGNSFQYLEMVVNELLPEIKARNLSNRADVYIDRNAFTVDEGRYYLKEARKLGFNILMHADQFTRGGVRLAVELGVLSADHLEVSDDEDIALIAKSGVIPVVLPGASLGLGTGFAPARKLLDAGAPLVIASDWNPGSAPMGNLLIQAAILGVYEKLTIPEAIAAITCRAATALNLKDRGIIRPGMRADFVGYPCNNYREIYYSQGNIMPAHVWKKGMSII